MLAERHCPKCGCTINNIIEKSRLGCGECYTYFKKELAPLIENVQRATQHKGKIPSNLAGKTKKELKLELKLAIEKEDYIKAAKIRDMLK
jgi:protein arginine kinase activator